MNYSLKKLEQVFSECGYSCENFNEDRLIATKEECLDIIFKEEPTVLTGWVFTVGTDRTTSVLDAVLLSERKVS